VSQESVVYADMKSVQEPERQVNSAIQSSIAGDLSEAQQEPIPMGIAETHSATVLSPVLAQTVVHVNLDAEPISTASPPRPGKISTGAISLDSSRQLADPSPRDQMEIVADLNVETRPSGVATSLTTSRLPMPQETSWPWSPPAGMPDPVETNADMEGITISDYRNDSPLQSETSDSNDDDAVMFPAPMHTMSVPNDHPSPDEMVVDPAGASDLSDRQSLRIAEDDTDMDLESTETLDVFMPATASQEPPLEHRPADESVDMNAVVTVQASNLASWDQSQAPAVNSLDTDIHMPESLSGEGIDVQSTMGLSEEDDSMEGANPSHEEDSMVIDGDPVHPEHHDVTAQTMDFEEEAQTMDFEDTPLPVHPMEEDQVQPVPPPSPFVEFPQPFSPDQRIIPSVSQPVATSGFRSPHDSVPTTPPIVEPSEAITAITDNAVGEPEPSFGHPSEPALGSLVDKACPGPETNADGLTKIDSQSLGMTQTPVIPSQEIAPSSDEASGVDQDAQNSRPPFADITNHSTATAIAEVAVSPKREDQVVPKIPPPNQSLRKACSTRRKSPPAYRLPLVAKSIHLPQQSKSYWTKASLKTALYL
jgi:hypothetical protein